MTVVISIDDRSDHPISGQLCYDLDMNNRSGETGALQVFRVYGWLHLTPILFFPLLQVVALLIPAIWLENLLPPVDRIENFLVSRDTQLPLIFSVIHSLILLGYLYTPGLHRKLGRWYLPLAIIFATAALIIEQRLFFPRMAYFQIHPFLNILLLLVAWLYGFRAVLAYTVGSILLEIVMGLFFPATQIFFSVSPDTSMTLQLDVWFGLVASRSVTFLVLGYVTDRLAAAQRQQSQALAEANQRLVRHAAALEQLTTSRERVRLSRELHDTLAHTLSALAVQFEAVLTVWEDIPNKAQEMLEGMLETTQMGLDETRRALRSLRASPLEELGLAGAVRVLAEDFAARQRLKLVLDVPEPIEDTPPEIEQAYYRVAQEALENISRHAQASQMEVRLLQQHGKLELVVKDDGLGFEPGKTAHPEASNGHPPMGLKGMQERAEMIAAQLVVESQPGKGATVRLTKVMWT